MNENYRKVFGLLMERRSLSFSQLRALSALQESQVRDAVRVLEGKDLVRISDKQDPSSEIITTKEAAFNVFGLLVKHRSMPLLQLCALSALDESQASDILDVLEEKNLVRITDKQDPFKEIITIKEAAFAAGRSFGD